MTAPGFSAAASHHHPSSPLSRTHQLQAVDSLTRELGLRARRAGPEFADIAAAARKLHGVLRHLRAEVDDPDSLLAGFDGRTTSGAGVGADNAAAPEYAHQLSGILGDCDFTLRQLEAVLEEHGGDEREYDLDDRERVLVALIGTRLYEQKTSIDQFLDAVQLHNPAAMRYPPSPHMPAHPQATAGGAPPPTPNPDRRDVNLDIIKDKVDAIAEKLYRGRDQYDESEDEEELWQKFKAELEAEGFSREVLRRNKEVLRAYIREMDASISQSGGATPTVRGMLEQESAHMTHARPYTGPGHDMQSPIPHTLPRAIPTTAGSGPAHHQSQYYLHGTYLASPDRNATYESSQPPLHSYASFPRALPEAQNGMSPPYGVHDNHKFLHSMKNQDRDPDAQHESMLPLLPPPKPMAYENERCAGGALLPFHRQNSERQSSSDDGYASDRSDSMALISTQDLIAQMGNMHLGQPSGQPMLPAARQPHLLGYTDPASDAAASMPMSPIPGFTYPPGPGSQPQPPLPPLAPDNYGQEIPLTATWTRIKRSLISLEVLDHARVRYEARPDFVAVLGVLSKDQIAHLAQQSAACRAARLRRRQQRKRARERPRSPVRETSNNSTSYNSSPDDDDLDDQESDTSEDDTDYDRPSSDDKSRSSIPFVVPVPLGGRAAEPRGILKNKNENHVRWGPSPYEVDPNDGEPRSQRHRDSDRKRDGRRRRERHRGDRERDRDRDRDRDSKDRDHHRDRDRDRDRERDREHRHRAADRDRDRHRDRDRDRERDYDSDRDQSWERDRDRDREHRRHHHGHHAGRRSYTYPEDKRERESKKRAWGGTLGAVGIGGAAASLLSVLAEAAAAAF